MKVFDNLPSCSLLCASVLTLSCLLVSAAHGQNWCAPTAAPIGGEQNHELRVVAFGTSVMWGDGLMPEHTFREQVSEWLGTQTGRPVRLWTWAHSAAVLKGVTMPDNWIAVPGDLNYGGPTVEQQIDCAAHSVEVSVPDLILIEGCINDVGAESIVYPWTNPESLVAETDDDCGDSMRDALKHIHARFPAAITVVVGYYPLVSERSPAFGFFGLGGTKRIVDHIDDTKIAEAKAGVGPDSDTNLRQDPKISLSRKAVLGRIARNAELFYQQSKCDLRYDVVKMGTDAPGQFFFAAMPEATYAGHVNPTMNPDWAYGAAESHEWKISYHLFGIIFDGDERYRFRLPECKGNWRQLGFNRFVCETSPAFHPNIIGAATYASSVEAAVPADVLAKWKQGQPSGPSLQIPVGAQECSKN